MDLRPILFLALALPFMAAAAYASDPGSCYSIQDADARAYCLAKARKDRNVCYNVQSPDLRSMCLAEVGK